MRTLGKRLPDQPQARIFAYVDADGICRAFRHSLQQPGPACWKEVNEQRLGWLGSTLPASAFIDDCPVLPALAS